MKSILLLQLAVVVAVIMCLDASVSYAAEDKALDYSRQVRPILSNYCYRCHGPDGNERKANLRLDVRDDATKKSESGSVPIIPGRPAESELVRRITSNDPEVMMPPPSTKKSLSQTEKEILTKWIEDGAKFESLWSFSPPKRTALPTVSSRTWLRNEIDAFVAARHEAEGLSPNLEADRTTLIRRATLDLTGLPPTVEEIDRFVSDRSTDAFDRLIDRLIASPNYGERMTLDWLDASRFADTHGYHIDAGRDMTRWREWVIQSFNDGKPFDEFTIEQLAGDLLPNPTLEQRIGSGFNRNHMINFEGGAIPEEYHTAYIVDRVNTTGTVWLGLTIGCAQCHDHKYDPISQKEYYQLFSFFYNVPENGLDGSKGNASPLVKAPSLVEQLQLSSLQSSIAIAERELLEPDAELDARQREWESQFAGPLEVEWAAAVDAKYQSSGGATFEKQADGSYFVGGANPGSDVFTVSMPNAQRGESGGQKLTAVRIEGLPDDRLTNKGPGRSVNGNFVMTNVAVRVERENGASRIVKIKEATAEFSQATFPVTNAIDGDPQTGWAIHPQMGKAHSIILSFAEPLALSDGERLVTAISFESQFGQHVIGRIRVATSTSPYPHGVNLPEGIRKVLAVSREGRSQDQANELQKYFRAEHSAKAKKLAQLKQQFADAEKKIRTVMVMQEMEKPRDAFLLVRGQYDKRGEKVAAATPVSLPPLPTDSAANRLGLARWLVDRKQPLTSRVTVNRLWQTFFGTGLVKTSEDLGSQGNPPSHPELLDWLSVEFQDSEWQRKPNDDVNSDTGFRWDVKRMVRRITGSATYRQSSKVTSEGLAKDPENRLLARGPRYRLPAEFVRDQVLAVSGLIDRRIGGSSVFPYQPKGLWEELMSREDGANWTAQKYTPSHGVDLYRRSMYIFWKRTSPPPTMSTFDAPDRETCSVRRAITNTPLQSLILMNDPTYVEAARIFAERIVQQEADDRKRIGVAFRSITGREAKPAEVAIIVKVLQRERQAFRGKQKAAVELLSTGEFPRDEKLDAVEIAAWTMVVSTIFNLDETITKG